MNEELKKLLLEALFFAISALLAGCFVFGFMSMLVGMFYLAGIIH